MQHKELRIRIPWPSTRPSLWRISRWLPTPGNVLSILLMLGALLWLQDAGATSLGTSSAASTASTGTIAYQGRLADANGTPITNTVNMIFRLYTAATGGAPLWTEQWTGSNAVQVSDGLFNVMLGSLEPIPQNIFTANSNLWLGITVGTDDEMSPRVQLGNVPWAVQALSIPNGSITTDKIADGAVTAIKLGPDVNFELADGSVTESKLADGSVTSRKLTPTSAYVRRSDRQSTSSTAWQDIPNTSVTLNIDSAQKILVWAQVSVFQNGTDGYPHVRLIANGQEIIRASTKGGGTPGGAWSYETIPLTGLVNATPGPLTIKMQFLSAASYGTVYVTDRSIVAMAIAQ